MIRPLLFLLVFTSSPQEMLAEELGYHQTLYDLFGVARDLDMQPPILVECLPAGSETPFRFVENPMRP